MALAVFYYVLLLLYRTLNCLLYMTAFSFAGSRRGTSERHLAGNPPARYQTLNCEETGEKEEEEGQLQSHEIL